MDQRDPIVLQKLRKQGIRFFRFWQEIIYKSLIPTFGKHAITTKVGIKLL